MRTNAFGRQVIIGATLTVASIGMFFWWGLHFEIFGHKIQFDGPQIGFFFWFAAMGFGAGFTAGGWRAGAACGGGVALLLGGALLLGIALGNYG